MPYRLVGIIVLSMLLLSTALVQRAYGAFFDGNCENFPYPHFLYRYPGFPIGYAWGTPPCPLQRGQVPSTPDAPPGYLSPQFNSDPLFLPPDIARALGYKVLPPPRSQGGRGQDLLGGVRVGEVLTPLGGRSSLLGGGTVGKGRPAGRGGYGRDGARSPSRPEGARGGEGRSDGSRGGSVFDRVPGLTGEDPDEGGDDTPSDPCASFFDLVPGLTGPRKTPNETIFGPIPDLFEKSCRQLNRSKQSTGGFF